MNLFHKRGSRGGKMGEFSPPLFLSPLLSFYSYPSNIEIIFDFSDIIIKIHPPFQNPGSALVSSELWSKKPVRFQTPSDISFWQKVNYQGKLSYTANSCVTSMSHKSRIINLLFVMNLVQYIINQALSKKKCRGFLSIDYSCI